MIFNNIMIPRAVGRVLLKWYPLVCIWTIPILWIGYMLHPLVALAVFISLWSIGGVVRYLERKSETVSQNSAHPDEISDKILVLTTLALLFAEGTLVLSWTYPLFWYVTIIVLCECILVSAREVQPARALLTTPTIAAYSKTVFLKLSCFLLLVNGIKGEVWQHILEWGVHFMVIAALFAIWTSFEYFHSFRFVRKM